MERRIQQGAFRDLFVSTMQRYEKYVKKTNYL